MEFLEPEDEYLVTQFVKDAAIKVYFDNAGVMCLNCVLTQGKDRRGFRKEVPSRSRWRNQLLRAIPTMAHVFNLISE
jgi:hypothetical protein